MNVLNLTAPRQNTFVPFLRYGNNLEESQFITTFTQMVSATGVPSCLVNFRWWATFIDVNGLKFPCITLASSPKFPIISAFNIVFKIKLNNIYHDSKSLSAHCYVNMAKDAYKHTLLAINLYLLDIITTLPHLCNNLLSFAKTRGRKPALKAWRLTSLAKNLVLLSARPTKEQPLQIRRKTLGYILMLSFSIKRNVID